ncbi:MAG: TetR/AcrR family transcriptional regulator, partial [Proteobacteria bacterium]|nr:TetR/AcrR family transcriptional regulator [Pseudomonadota bacterium]
MSIREQQKAERKKAMLAVAATLFKKQGFQKTTMDMIATQAGFGVATLYKYFKSKGGIVRELMLPDMLLMFELGERIIQQPPNDPSDAIVAHVRGCMKFAKGWRDKWLLRLIAVPSIPD